MDETLREQVFFLDVNVPMYAAGKDHPYKAPCAWLMREIAEGRLMVAIDSEIIQEVLYRYGTLRLWNIGETMAMNLLEIIPVVYPVTSDDMRVAIELFHYHAPHGVKARDILHAVVMRNNGLTTIISTDRHFDLIVELTRLEPQALFPG